MISMVSMEDQKIEFVDYTEPMHIKVNFTIYTGRKPTTSVVG